MKSIRKYFDSKKHMKLETNEKMSVIWNLIDDENEEKITERETILRDYWKEVMNFNEDWKLKLREIQKDKS